MDNTQSLFIKRIKKINSTIKIIGQYTNAKKRIRCQCSICDYQWDAIPNNLLRGHGCPKCGKIKNSNNRRKSADKFANELKTINPTIELLEPYTSSNTKIKCHCLVCDTIWNTIPNSLLKGHGCPKCAKKRIGNKSRKSSNQFANELKAVNPTIELLEPYTSSSIKVKCYCLVCGNIWSALPHSLLKGHGCPKCAFKKNGLAQSISHDDFVQMVHKKNPNITIIGRYVNSRTTIKARCNNCGYEWDAYPYTLSKGDGCVKCMIKHRGISQRKSPEQFSNKVKEIHPNFVLLSDYEKANVPVKCRCLRCGFSWDANPSNLLKKNYGCPRCSKSSTSFMEQVILLSLKFVLGDDKVLSRDTKVIGLELDIYIPSLNLAFEPGSWHLHQSSLERDIHKKELCSQKGITLVTIYDSFKNETVNLPSDVLTYPIDLGQERNHKTLRNVLLPRIFQYAGIVDSVSDENWCKIEQKAIEYSLSITTEIFKKRVSTLFPKIEVLGDYINDKTKIHCRCFECGNEWYPIAGSLMRNHGCPVCQHKEGGRKRIQSEEAFKSRLSLINPNVELLSSYVRAHDKVTCRCKICNNEWQTTPSSLIRGYGCPKCGRVKRMETIKKQKSI